MPEATCFIDPPLSLPPPPHRDLLRSTVTALYAAVSNCLELSTVVQSVLGHTHPDGLGVSHSNHEDIESRLSERLIAQQGEKNINCHVENLHIAASVNA